MTILKTILSRMEQYRFLFEELTKRDFKKKYKRTVFGMLWSMLAPLMQLLVMALVFTQFFKDRTEHYLIYLFCGNLVFSYFKESTNGGMQALTTNAGILTKVKTPKYIFLLSKNMSAFINFLLILVIFSVFVVIDGLVHIRMLLMIYPIVCLLLFNIGVGSILSAIFVFFRDMQYLYDVFTMLLMYLSAIFYPIEQFPLNIQRLFLFNPLYAYIHYIRLVVIQGVIPPLNLHVICGGYAILAVGIGSYVYKKYNYRFIYYM